MSDDEKSDAPRGKQGGDGKPDDEGKEQGAKPQPRPARWPWVVGGVVLLGFVAVVLFEVFAPHPDVWTDDAYVTVALRHGGAARVRPGRDRAGGRQPDRARRPGARHARSARLPGPRGHGARRRWTATAPRSATPAPTSAASRPSSSRQAAGGLRRGAARLRAGQPAALPQPGRDRRRHGPAAPAGRHASCSRTQAAVAGAQAALDAARRSSTSCSAAARPRGHGEGRPGAAGAGAAQPELHARSWRPWTAWWRSAPSRWATSSRPAPR